MRVEGWVVSENADILRGNLCDALEPKTLRLNDSNEPDEDGVIRLLCVVAMRDDDEAKMMDLMMQR